MPIRLYFALLIILFVLPAGLRAQSKATAPSSTEIYIPLRGREEVKVIPLLDTLDVEKEYLFKMTFSDRYSFSELFFDKGLATHTDSFLSIRPKTSMTEGYDTATLRIIGFAGSNRILLYHKFLLLAQAKSFPMVNANKNSNITVNNVVLERNMDYKKHDFPEGCLFNYLDNGHFIKDNNIISITVSLVNHHTSKTLFIHDSKPTEEMIKEIHKAKNGTLMFIRLDIKNGKKTKSVWTRFTLIE